MLNAYLWLKFLHVSGAIVWVGGAVALAIGGARRIHQSDPAAIRVLHDQQALIMRALILPATIVTVVAGIAMTQMRGLMQPWTVWGMIVALTTVVIGAGFIRRYSRDLALVHASDQPDAARVPDPARQRALRRRIKLLGMFNIFLLVTAVWAMVYKPAM